MASWGASSYKRRLHSGFNQTRALRGAEHRDSEATFMRKVPSLTAPAYFDPRNAHRTMGLKDFPYDLACSVINISILAFLTKL